MAQRKHDPDTLPVPLDPITRRKLVLVKQLYDHALMRSAAKHNTVDRTMCVIEFDLAIESALKAAVSSLKPSKTPADHFQGLLGQCLPLVQDSFHATFPDTAHISWIHNLRNSAQHEARYPNDTEVSDSRTYTRDFLKKLFALLWDLDFDQLSLADAVEHGPIRELLRDAESALPHDDFSTATEKAAVALHMALGCVKFALLRGWPHSMDLTTLRGQSLSGEVISVESPLAILKEPLEKLRDLRVYYTVGVNYAEHVKYSRIVGTLYHLTNGEFRFTGMKSDISSDDAQYVVSYCTDSILRIQSIVGDIDNPFGAEAPSPYRPYAQPTTPET